MFFEKYSIHRGKKLTAALHIALFTKVTGIHPPIYAPAISETLLMIDIGVLAQVTSMSCEFVS